MSRVSMAEIELLAKLAKLAVSPSDALGLRDDLEEILAHASELQALDTEEVPVMEVARSSQPLRDDCVQASLTQEQALSGTKDQSEGYFVVPAIIAEPNS